MDYEMRIPNGIGEEMLSEAYEKFDIELKQTEYGPKLIGSMEELEKVQEFFKKSIEKRLKELENPREVYNKKHNIK
ncbi:MAG: hypothetical protein ACI4RQ_05605 [Methanobrevibacter wolinii]|uniref:hypothetical protein n=1 Tax=Methanobrevibacter wolinii TaxID=190977 RepID=UPI0005B29161|nr:hypothetical protein [Methanobrevibacter wolinii]MDD5959232.1 hypothetical protein [Methanobrevibacter wolinii]